MRYLSLLLLTLSAFANQPKPGEALQRLMKGNERFVADQQKSSTRRGERRLAKKTFQHPYAVIIACSDSRVAPEILFDAGIGDLFIVRDAGNVLSGVAMESVGYAVHALNSPVILVVGHQNCGAVDAVLKGQDQSIPKIANLIRPATEKAQKQRTSNLLERATENNALNMQQILLKNADIRKKVDNKQLIVKAAYYDFTSGKVKLLP